MTFSVYSSFVPQGSLGKPLAVCVTCVVTDTKGRGWFPTSYCGPLTGDVIGPRGTKHRRHVSRGHAQRVAFPANLSRRLSTPRVRLSYKH
jgi:hypothetical protein